MKKKYFLNLVALALLFSYQAFSQVDVTFRVDMSAESVSADGVHITGTINDWNTSSTTLTQEGSTDIYSVTVQLDQGWHRYKFLNGNAWGTDESAGYPCAPSNGDRFLYVNDSGMSITLESVPFNGCNSSGTGFEVTFNVDMSSEASISGDGVHMAGWHTDWNPSVLSLPDVNGDIHSATLRLPTPSDYPITFEYKYLNGNGWGTEETPESESTCSTVTGTNRIVTVNNSGDNIYNVFNGCDYSLNTEEFNENAFEFVYNPNQRVLNFYGEGSHGSMDNVSVFDVKGQLVKSVPSSKDITSLSIDFQTYSDGLYFVRLTSNSGQVVKKILVY
ncbi:T9SS type A sorting domain-containing protein [Gaetbulibacter sp. NE]|uniref:T9SS type A sorting domain-containing protein n=1 Tax=Gaetbulibacter sp. NE TaxID=2982307 RepID=UPI0021D14A75|nr:T9SS type A sorting domain-containing protein [Gaetbulibacter sp. NE]